METKNETAMEASLSALLGASLHNVEKGMPCTGYEVPRISRDTGTPVIFQLHGLSSRELDELSRLDQDANVAILLAGCEAPNLKSKALLDKLGGVTPADTVKRLLLPGEIKALADAVAKLSGFGANAVREVKNG